MTQIAKPFIVEFTTVVDHPEKRDSSYRPVPVGTVIPTKWEYAKHTDAVRMYDAIRTGYCDFGSEYVEKVRVIKRHDNKTPSLVRREVERTRAEVQS